MSTFGEVVFESSRAFPDDEEEEGSSSDNITFEGTNDLEKVLNDLKTTRDGNLYVFQGKVACGFGSGFVDEDHFRLLGSVYFGGFDGTVDSLLSRRQRPIIKLYYGPGRVVFALVDNYGLPRSATNDIVNAISFILDVSKNIVVFHSEPIVAYRGEGDVQGKLFHLHSSTVQAQSSSIVNTISVLPQPNIIHGITAAILTQCEALGKPGLVLLTYCETELVDSISTQPFFQALDKAQAGSFKIKEDFSKFNYSLQRSSKANTTPVRNSNLYT